MGSFGLAENFNPLALLPVFVVSAKTTALARRLMARSSWDGTVIRATKFIVGSGGYDPYDYTQATPVNPEAQSLELPVFTAAITDKEWANQSCSSYYCVLDLADAVAPLGEIGIISKVIDSPVGAEINMEFLSAIGHFPLKTKSVNMQLALRVLRQS